MPEEKDISEEYKTLKKKYKLPEFKDLDKEFGIGKLEETDFVLRSIINKMSERLEQVLKILGDIIQPDNNLSNLCEAEAFSDDEKKKIFELYKKISYYNKGLVINDFEHNEEAAADVINNVFKEWRALKQEFLKILKKIKEAWKKEALSKLELGYFG